MLRVMEQKVPVTKGHPSGRFWNARTITASRVLRRIALVLIGAQFVAIERGTIRRDGRVTSIRFCLPSRRSLSEQTTPPWPTRKCPN